MNRKFIAITAVAAALAVGGTFAVLSQGGVPRGDTSTPPAATVGPTPIEPTETPTLTEQLQTEAGMTPEAYAALVADVAAMDLEGMILPEVGPAFDAIAAAYGMPVVLVEHHLCSISGLPAWGITGALAGPNAGCGTGWTETMEGALEKVVERAERRGWDSGDYAVVVTG